MKKKKLIIGGVIILVILGAGGALWKLASSAGKPVVSPMPTVKVDRGVIEKVVFAKGVITEVKRQEIKAEVKAKVTQVIVRVGDAVKAGDLLFSMDEGDVKLALLQEDLAYQSKAGEMQKAASAAASDLVRAPIGGKVAKILVKDGDRVEQDSLVAEISNPTVMEVKAAFAPIGIEKVEAGRKVKIFIDNWIYLDGQVTKVDKRGKADIGGGISHDISVRVTNPGSLATGEITSAVILLPGGPEISSVGIGEINDTDAIKVKAGATGVVLKVDVREGDNIGRNGILAKLDITTGRNNLKDSRLALRQAELAKELKTRELDKFRVTAGQDGTVTEINVTLGQEAPMDKPAIVISSASGLELRAKVEEGDIPYLHIGQDATVFANAFGERRFPGTITEIAGQGKSEGNVVVFETKIRIKEPGPLRVGMTGDVDIIVDKKEGVLRLPVSAVSIDGRKGTVVVPGQIPKPQEVKLGLEGDEFIEITGGLKIGDTVLVNPTVRQPQGF